MSRQSLMMIAAALLFAVGGFFLFRGEQRDEVQDVRSARMSADTEKQAKSTQAIAEATQKLSSSVQQLGAEAQRSDSRLDKLEGETADLKERVVAIEEFIPTRQSAIEASFVAGDFGVSGMAKQAIAEALMSNGTAPNSNSEAGLPVATSLRGQSLRETRVVRGGVIELVYDQQSGVDGGIIRLVPDMASARRSGMVNWRCETEHYPEIHKYMPSCQFIGNH